MFTLIVIHGYYTDLFRYLRHIFTTWSVSIVRGIYPNFTIVLNILCSHSSRQTSLHICCQ